MPVGKQISESAQYADVTTCNPSEGSVQRQDKAAAKEPSVKISLAEDLFAMPKNKYLLFPDVCKCLLVKSFITFSRNSGEYFFHMAVRDS